MKVTRRIWLWFGPLWMLLYDFILMIIFHSGSCLMQKTGVSFTLQRPAFTFLLWVEGRMVKGA
jgi:hypothetical protein